LQPPPKPSSSSLDLRRFGFNNGKTMVDGLDGENTISHTWQSGDFATIVYQLRLLGFNAVRLPFLFNDLLARKPQVGAMLNWAPRVCVPTNGPSSTCRVTQPLGFLSNKSLPDTHNGLLPPAAGCA
jgi:hypothetical protein